MRIVSLFCLLFSVKAFAYPEMVRHSYLHCITCHTSNVGGDVLTEYGRSLSRELLTQQTLGGIPLGEGDEKFMFGLVKTPEWLSLGGGVRVLQTMVDSKERSYGRFFVMQVDLDASAKISEKWRAFASLGRVEPVGITDPVAKDFVASPRHGIEYNFNNADDENHFSVRAGRFMPAYGIMFVEHAFINRNEYQLIPGRERYAGELSWYNERSSIIATGILANPESNKIRDETGGIIQAATGVREKSKVGINFYQSDREDKSGPVYVKYKRKVYGAFAHMTFNEKWYGLLQIDRPYGMAGTWGVSDIFKVGYEISQGLHLIGVQEFLNRDTKQPSKKYESYSVGAEWFPRVHFDFYGLYRQTRDTSRSNDFQQEIWLLGHFYL